MFILMFIELNQKKISGFVNCRIYEEMIEK